MTVHKAVTRRGANHGLHLFLTIFTMGLWAPVWVICSAVGRKEVTTIVKNDLVTGYQYQWNPYSGRWQ